MSATETGTSNHKRTQQTDIASRSEKAKQEANNSNNANAHKKARHTGTSPKLTPHINALTTTRHEEKNQNNSKEANNNSNNGTFTPGLNVASSVLR